MSFTFKLARRTARLRAAVCASLVLSAFACNGDDTTAPLTESTQDPVGAVDQPAIEALTSATASGIAFGDFHLPDEYFKAPYSGSLIALWSSTASTRLSRAKNAAMRVVVSMAGHRSYYTNSNGTFNMTKWKNRISAWRSFPFGTYISSGTILGHYLVDEPFCAGCWGGTKITISQIEEMAKYSKSIWPSMATGVRAAPSKFPTGTYRYLDFAWAQWEGPHHGTSFKLTPSQYRDKEVSAAKARGLGLVFGLNYINGGDGSSGILGTYDNARAVNRWQMSASEVKNVGGVLAASSYACGLVSWQYDSRFLSRSGMTSAMSYVGGIAKNRARAGCVK